MADDIDPELSKSREAVALFINRFNVLVSADVTRIAFGEAVTGVEANYRTAVVMRTSDAIALADLLRATTTRFAQLNVTEAPDTLSATVEVGDGEKR